VSPKILDRHYKIVPSTDHRAKFHAGRPTHLGDLAREKTSGVKLKSAPQAIAFGGTNNQLQWQVARKGKRPSTLATVNTTDNDITK